MQLAWKNAGACYAGQREQAPSPQGLVSSRISSPTPATVGAGLLAKAAGQLASILNVPPSSRASSLPHRTVANTISATPPIPCGSELARDEIAPVPKQNTPTRITKKPPSYSPHLHPLSSYASLRLCLQLSQNPPACAPCPWVLLSSCHCPSVVGFSSPDDIRLHESHQLGIRLHSMVAVRMAPSGAPVLGMSPVY